MIGRVTNVFQRANQSAATGFGGRPFASSSESVATSGLKFDEGVIRKTETPSPQLLASIRGLRAVGAVVADAVA